MEYVHIVQAVVSGAVIATPMLYAQLKARVHKSKAEDSDTCDTPLKKDVDKV